MNRSVFFPFDRFFSRRLWLGVILLGCVLLLGGAVNVFAQPALPISPQPPSPPGNPLTIQIGGMDPSAPQQISMGIQLLVIITILSLAPAILMMITCFVRVVVVLGFIRRALGLQEVPPNQVVLGLALILSFFVMTPTLKQVNDEALQPYFSGQITPVEAYEAASFPLREFMFRHTRKTDLGLFVRLSRIDQPQDKSEVPNHVLIPAFMISELKTAFIIGFIIYIPFLIIDMVVASILLSMGMMMLPPVIISLPFKILLFVLVDGWNLVIGSLMKSFEP